VGEGATAIVHKAKHETTGALAALKIARAPLASEAAIVSAIGRRWGPRFLDAGATWVALEWTEGTPLDLESADAAIVAHGVARALAELHAAGVRHGDVKPANVLVTGRTPKVDTARDRGATLIDLGLSTRAGDAARGGTPRYAAPELREGRDVGPHADLFALGVMLAEILDPAVRASSDPAAQALASKVASEPMQWAKALLASMPAARPSAEWIAHRAAALLGLRTDEGDAREDRRMRVRRAYLAVRSPEISKAASVAVDGLARAWLEEALRAVAPLRNGRGAIGESSPLERARLLTALVGTAAAAWPTADLGAEEELLERLDRLAREREPYAWSRAEVLGGAPGSVRAAIPRAEMDRTAWLARDHA
jgi:hypothetical protein